MKVYVFGLGHIGLPMAAWISLKGYTVEGIDINPLIIEDIKNGSIKIHEFYNHIHISRIAQELFLQKRLLVSSNFERIDNEPSIFIITVGIEVSEDGSQDLLPIYNVLYRLLPKLVDGDLIIFRSTVIPGTCDKLVLPMLKTINKKIYFAYAPETISETHAFIEMENNTNILAAIDEESYKLAESFLQSLTKASIYRASSIIAAEMAKVVQNIIRDVNIALVNELSDAASILGVDIYELRKLSNTHPRVELLLPGPGVGGYCLPNALKYLEEAFSSKEETLLPLIRTARQVNEKRPEKIVNIILQALKDVGKDIKTSKIAIIGLAMKDYCADCRHSPALAIISILISKGAQIQAHDPLVPIQYPFQADSFINCIAKSDCIVITAKQEGLRFDVKQIYQLMSSPPIVVDTRNIFPDDEYIRLYRL